MNTNIQIFTNDIFGEIRTCQVNNQIMFVGKDVATALGYKNPSNALEVHVDSEDKTSYLIQVSGSAYKTNTLFVNESGLYSLILSSKLPQAKAFKRWVTSEVLPQIRQTGGVYPPCVGLYGHRAGQGVSLAPGVPYGLAPHRLRHGRSGERQNPSGGADAERIRDGNGYVSIEKNGQGCVIHHPCPPYHIWDY